MMQVATRWSDQQKSRDHLRLSLPEAVYPDNVSGVNAHGPVEVPDSIARG